MSEDVQSRREGQSGGKGLAIVEIVACGFGVLVVSCLLVVRFLPPLDYSREKAHRISCASNLKMIGIALRMYSIENQGYFPPQDGAEGLEVLRSGGYLENPKLYICPSGTTVVAADGEPLTEEHVDYHYRGGRIAKDSSTLDIVAWDKEGNHIKYGNVLFVDGHIAGFAGESWQKNAGRLEQ